MDRQLSNIRVFEANHYESFKFSSTCYIGQFQREKGLYRQNTKREWHKDTLYPWTIVEPQKNFVGNPREFGNKRFRPKPFVKEISRSILPRNRNIQYARNSVDELGRQRRTFVGLCYVSTVSHCRKVILQCFYVSPGLNRIRGIKRLDFLKRRKWV